MGNLSNMKSLIPFFLLCILPMALFGQKPEKQISFARETKAHLYYVKQAELWWKEIEKDKTSEESWYNYYRACRNTHGSANWKSDFVKESPYLKFGADILKLMKENIPGTFTYYYVAGSDGGVDPVNGSYLLKAYEMNPNFEGIHANLITYAVSISDNALRRKVNKEWFARNGLSQGLLSYGYNRFTT